MKLFRRLFTIVATITVITASSLPAQAAEEVTTNVENAREGANYIDDFDPVYYAATYPDVYAAFGNNANLLYRHYLLFGKAEGRYPNAGAAAASTGYIDGFDPVFYAARYPDVYAAFGNNAALLYQHYLLFGKAEGRLPNDGTQTAANAASTAATTATTAQTPMLLTTAGTYLSEQYVYNKIMSLKNTPGFTEGTLYTNSNYSINKVTCEGYVPGHFTGYGCYGYMMDMLEYATDYSCPIVLVPASYNNIPELHVGDSPRIGNDAHTVIITNVAADGHTVTVTEANYGGKVHWGRVLNLSDPSLGLVYIDTIWAK